MGQLQPIRGGSGNVVRIAQALNLALAALAADDTKRMEPADLAALIERARDLADDLANAVDALPEGDGPDQRADADPILLPERGIAPLAKAWSVPQVA